MSERLTRGVVPVFQVPEPELNVGAGVFVSLLTEHGTLRGCVGTVDGDRPLWQGVVEMAVGTAVEDPVFAPLSVRELGRTDIEISVLTPFRPIDIESIIVGKHGLYLVRGPKRAVLLPQVAKQYRWSRQELLGQLALRAGLERDAWKSNDVQVFAFEAQVFSNTSLQ